MHHLVPLVKPHKTQNKETLDLPSAAAGRAPVAEANGNPAYTRTQANTLELGASPKKREVQEDLQVYKMENGTRSKIDQPFYS